MASVGLLGDVMLGRGVAEALGETPAAELWGEELRELCSLDLVVCNLECCISERGEPTRRIPGKPFFFRAPRSPLRRCARSGCAPSPSPTTTPSTTRPRPSPTPSCSWRKQESPPPRAGRGPMRPGGDDRRRGRRADRARRRLRSPGGVCRGPGHRGDRSGGSKSPLPALAARGLGLPPRALRSHHRVPALGAEHGGRAAPWQLSRASELQEAGRNWSQGTPRTSFTASAGPRGAGADGSGRRPGRLPRRSGAAQRPRRACDLGGRGRAERSSSSA